LKNVQSLQENLRDVPSFNSFETHPNHIHSDRIFQLQNDDEQMKRDELQLQKEIRKPNAERQEFIPKARKGHISEEESTPQISVMYDKELGVKRRLSCGM
jgi:hypothetical protein